MTPKNTILLVLPFLGIVHYLTMSILKEQELCGYHNGVILLFLAMQTQEENDN